MGVAGVAGMMWQYSKGLPEYSQLQDYEPPVMTRVHAADGTLLAEYARERRLFLPIQAVPKRVIHAFIAAEDKNFYEHSGIDFSGIARAGLSVRRRIRHGRRPQGASTITQQVAKNFLLTNEGRTARSRKRCSRCASSAPYSKEKILELYLNEIYLGLGAYGVAAASLIYFDKSVHELTLAEVAYLAALPKAPNNYIRSASRERAIERRNYVIDRMVEDGYITASEGEKAKKRPLAVTTRPTGAHIFAAEYFAEEVRRDLYDKLRREEALRGRALGAHHARSEAAGFRAQGADRRPGALRRGAGLARRDAARSISPATGARKLAESRRCPISRPGGSRWCSRSTISGAHRPAARRASRAARCPRSARSASSRSTA